MTARERLQAIETRQQLWIRAHGRCEVCGKQLGSTWQMAHRIPQRTYYIRAHGKAVIHHALNLVAVCGLSCNNAVNLQNHPMERSRLVEKIKEELEGET